MLYLTTLATSQSREILDLALQSFLGALGQDPGPECLYKLYYEQAAGSGQPQVGGSTFQFPALSLSLAFDDASLSPVREAWAKATGAPADDSEYMVFADREGQMDDDEMDE